MLPKTHLFMPEPRASLASLDFKLPPDLEAGEPPEARGLRRDQVRLLVSFLSDGQMVHTHFHHLPDFLRAGDVLAINTSGTLKAAVHVVREGGEPLELHLSTRLPAGLCVVELRQRVEEGTLPFYKARVGETLHLPGGGLAILHGPYHGKNTRANGSSQKQRLWIAGLELPLPFESYLDKYGFPIRYKYVRDQWPIAYYQNVYVTEMGSAEMPSAGRAFTPQLITRLVARGVQIAPLILHTGVASLEEDELPYEEFYRLPAASARLINQTRQYGGRVIAVGTTTVRALETAAEHDGSLRAGEGWTDLVISPDEGLRSVDGLITGFHEPRSTHLSMMLALTGADHLRAAYIEACKEGYLWHEFGDLHLILP